MSFRPTILVVADRCFWAYSAIQQFIRAHLSDTYDIYTDYVSLHLPCKWQSPKSTIKHYYSRLKTLPYRRLIGSNNYDAILYLGYYFNTSYILPYKSTYIIKGIFTQGFPPQCSNMQSNVSYESFYTKHLKDANSIVCGSQQINDFYKSHSAYSFYANASYEDTFSRLTPKQINQGHRLVIGWTGNPSRDFKGYYDFVIPAVKLASSHRPGIVLKSRFSGPIKTLPRFYDDVDIVLIASIADAGPSMFTEAAFCDVPAISTYIGYPASQIIDGVNGFIVERNIESMAKKLVFLYDSREILFSFSNRIRSDVSKDLGTQPMIKRWHTLFEQTLRL